MREREFALGDVPNLHFAPARGIAAGDGEEFAIGRKADALDALAQTNQPRDQSGAIGFVQQHFVKTSHREQCAIGRIVQ